MARDNTTVSTGFRRGFLLSNPSKKKHDKPPKASCALLDVEDRKPLLFVNEDVPSETPVTLQNPFHILNNEEEDVGLTEVSTRRKAPQIQKVADDEAKLESTSSLSPRDERPLFEEIQVLPMFKNDPQNGAAEVKPSVNGTVYTDPLTPMNLSQLDSGSYSIPPSADLMRVSDNADVASMKCLSQLAQEVSRILWKLKRSDQDRAIDTFVSKHLHSEREWAFVWDSILEAIAQDPYQSNPSVRLGVVLLQHGLDSFVSFIQPNDNKRSRVLALGAANLVGCYFRSIRETDSSVAIKSWLTAALPQLAKVVLECPTKRSMLSQRCMTAAYDIVAAASEQRDGIPVHDVKLIIWDAMSTWDRLLEVQHGWIEKSLPNVKSIPGDLSCDISRKQCTLAVLHDWRLVTKENLRIIESILIEDGDSIGESRAELATVVCSQFTGEYMNGLSITIGGLSQTLCNDSPRLSAEQILTCMQCATELLHSIREKEGSDDVLSWKKERMRALLRGVAAWLGRSKKNLQSLYKASSAGSCDTGPGTVSSMQQVPSNCEKTFVEQVTDLCTCLLRSDTDDSVELVLAILSHLWSSSNGLPPDFIRDETSELSSASPKVPASYHLLLDELKHVDTHDSLILEPSEKALCYLVARCVQFRGPSLVDELVTRNGLRSSTIEVLAKVLSDTVQIGLSVNDAKEVRDGNKLSTVAGNAFLDGLGSSRYAQRRLMSSPELLCVLPVATVVPRLVSCGDSERSCNDMITAVTAALTQIMVSSLPNNVDEFVHVFVEALLQCDERMFNTNGGQDTGSAYEQDNLRSRKLCQKIAGKWRRYLLQNPVCGLHGFASVLISIGNSMFLDPSCTLPLELLGSVVGDEPSFDISTEEESLRVYFAVVALIRESLREMVKAGEITGTSGNVHNTKKREDLFSRLSPLLLLRRIPSTYYITAWRSVSGDHRDMMSLLSQLGDQLSARLDITEPSEKTNVTFSAEERRLAAEIAGRALPFYASPSCSCYHKICRPAFMSTLCLLKVFPGKVSRSPNTPLRAARAALYACCNHVSLAEDEEEGEGIIATISFVLEVLNAKAPAAVDDDEGIEEELVQLQAGCIEFIAGCLESTLQRRTRRVNDKKGSFGAVYEVKSSPNNMGKADSSFSAGSRSMAEALSTSCGSIVSLLKTGMPIASQLHVENNGILLEAASKANRHLSPSARTCLWNAFLVVSQRCREADGRLNSWASLTAPWILDWGSYATVDGDLRHPLCMAAALQVVFILLARTKSFDCLAGGTRNKDNTATSVRRAHEWAITSIKAKTEVGGDYARTTMRKAALKLLLAIFTIDQMGDTSNLLNWLSPGELGGAFTVLRGTANVDADAEVRTLAAHILGTMRVS